MILGSGEARAQSSGNTFIGEGQISATPVDLEVNPNGRVAVVRGNDSGVPGASDQKLSLWRTDTCTQVYPTQTNVVGRGQVPMNATTGVPMFANAIAVTNDRVLSIGSADTDPNIGGDDTLYVDILSLSYSTGVPVVQVLIPPGASTPYSLTGSTAQTQAGGAHDVAITPDGTLAVVTCMNWILVFNLADASLHGALNIGGTLSNEGPCFPYTARNSVEATNTRAVVTAGRLKYLSGAWVVVPWVYIVDLTSSPPQVMLENSQQHPAMSTRQNPHDIAITPNGWKAVVTASGSVGLYDLTTGSLAGTVHHSNDERYWGYVVAGEPVPEDLWHSVEASNTRAVVLSDTYNINGPLWRVRVFDISRSLTYLRKYECPASYAGDWAWDVDLSADGKVASIKTRLHDLALLDVPSADTSSTPTDFFWAGASLASSYPPPPNVSYPLTSSGFPGINSATVTLAQLGTQTTQRWAAFLGSPVGTSNEMRLRFYDLDAGDWPDPGSSVKTFTQTQSNPPGLLAPADLEPTPDGTDVVVRLTAPVVDSPYLGGLDWGRWGGASPAQVGTTFGGQGVCVGADSIRMGQTWVVSISSDSDSLTPAGWVHVVRSISPQQFP